MVYNLVSRGMLHEDKVTFAMLLTRIYMRLMTKEPPYDDEFNHLLRGGEALTLGIQTQQVPQISGLTNEQMEGLSKLCALQPFANAAKVANSGKDFLRWLNSSNPERDVPVMWNANELCKSS